MRTVLKLHNSVNYRQCSIILVIAMCAWIGVTYVRHSLTEEQLCNMTVMWYWPTFVEMEMPQHIAEAFPKVNRNYLRLTCRHESIHFSNVAV